MRHGHKWRPFVEVSSAADTHPAAAAAAASRRTELPESAGDLVTRTYTISTNAQVELTNVRSDEQASPTKRHSVFVREGAPQLDAPRMTFRAPLAAFHENQDSTGISSVRHGITITLTAL